MPFCKSNVLQNAENDTSMFGRGVMERMQVEIGRMLSSSSMTTQALHDARDSMNLSLNRPTTSTCASVRNLACTSCKGKPKEP